MKSKDRCLYTTSTELVLSTVAMVVVHRHSNALRKSLFPVYIHLDRRLCSRQLHFLHCTATFAFLILKCLFLNAGSQKCLFCSV